MNDQQKLKLAFADAWLRNPRDAYKAALEITRNDCAASLHIVDKWVWDKEVLDFKKSLIEEFGEEHFLPSKASMVVDILHRAEGAVADDSYVKLMKLAADMRGYIEKPGITVNNNSQTNNRVMIVPVGHLNDDGTVNADDWENKAIEQQQGLVS